MGWLERRTMGARNATLVGGAAVVLLVGAILVANVTPPAVHPAIEAGSGSGEAPVAAPITVSLGTLAKSDDYKGKDVCTCGFVHSLGSSPDHGLGGAHRNILHNVIVSERASPAPDAADAPDASEDRDGAMAICTWSGGAPPNVKQREPVCVRGAYVGPIVKQCSVVPSCP